MAEEQLAANIGADGENARSARNGLRLDGNRLLDGLNEQQIRAVTAPVGRTVVLAGAGSGKTRVLTRRVAWRIVKGQTDPARVLVLTFTRKAANELRQRQRGLGLRDAVPAGTFHSFALTQLRERWTDRRTVPPAILESKLRLLAQTGARRSDVELPDVAAEIDWARARMIEPGDYDGAARAAGRAPVGDAGFIAEVMTRYQQEKRRRRVVDFDDLLSLAIRDLRADHDYAEAVRWRHRHFYVDEFQDVNPLQHTLLELWLGDRNDLFVVGDPRQAIYGWNGSDPDLLDRAAGSDATVIQLSTNYRSTAQILAASASALGPDTEPMVSYRGRGPGPTVENHGTDTEEAQAIARSLTHHRKMGRAWDDMAVLVRTNAQLAVIERELTAAEVPSCLRSGAGPLASPEVKAMLKELSRPGIDLRFRLERLDAELAEDGAAAGVAAERHDNMGALSRLVHDYLSTEHQPTGAGLAAWLQTLQSGDVDTATPGVDLTTFHGAKGLEWPVVHLAGIETGFVPIAYATTGDQIAEERRLLYVAMTRAADELTIHWAAQRMFGTRVVERQRSPWLGAIAVETDPVARRTRSAAWRRHVERSRRYLGEPADGRDVLAAADPNVGVSTEDLYRRLQAWRDKRARASGVPGRAVIDDHTLRRLAETRPSTTAQVAVAANLRPAKLTRLAPELLQLIGDAEPPADD